MATGYPFYDEAMSAVSARYPSPWSLAAVTFMLLTGLAGLVAPVAPVSAQGGETCPDPTPPCGNRTVRVLW